jgi:hypothetical protein
VDWPQQELRVIWLCNRDDPEKTWEFILQDETAGFRAVARVFHWQRNFDLLTSRSLYFGGGPEGSAFTSAEEVEKRTLEWVRHYSRGLISREKLITSTVAAA